MTEQSSSLLESSKAERKGMVTNTPSESVPGCSCMSCQGDGNQFQYSADGTLLSFQGFDLHDPYGKYIDALGQLSMSGPYRETTPQQLGAVKHAAQNVNAGTEIVESQAAVKHAAQTVKFRTDAVESKAAVKPVAARTDAVANKAAVKHAEQNVKAKTNATESKAALKHGAQNVKARTDPVENKAAVSKSEATDSDDDWVFV